MVVGFHLHQGVYQLGRGCVFLAFARVETGNFSAFDDRGIVRIRHDSAARVLLVRVLDHLEQRLVLRHAVDGPVGVEDLVAAVLGVRLGEHHQFNVGRVALGVGEGLQQVVDFIVRHRQAQVGIRLFQRGAACAHYVDRLQRLGFEAREQAGSLVRVAQHGFGHAVVQQCCHGLHLFAIQFPGRAQAGAQDAALQVDAVGNAAFHPVDMRHAAVVHDIGGLGSPGRDGAETGNDDKFFHHAFSVLRQGWLAVSQQAVHAVQVVFGQGRSGIDKVDKAGLDRRNGRQNCLKLVEEALATERGQGVGTRQNQHSGGVKNAA